MIRKTLSKQSIQRFWEKVQKTDACWLWMAAKNDSGYGVFGVGRETDKAHRIAWKLIKGKIPNGLFACHHCDNPSCVNPDHIFLGTNADNVKDMLKKGRNSKPPPMGGWNRLEKPKEMIPMLGKIADTEIAKKFGFNKHTIQRFRRSLGIAALPSQTKFKSGDPHPCWSKKGRR